jgi:hypothetical protein
MINSLEIVRKQIEDQRRLASTTEGNGESAGGGPAAGASVSVAALDALDRKALDVEHQLVSNAELQSDDKYFVERDRVYMNLIWLSGEVGNGAGDVAGGADSRPTATSAAVLATIERDLAAARTAYAAFMQRDLVAFNKAATGKLQQISLR